MCPIEKVAIWMGSDMSYILYVTGVCYLKLRSKAGMSESQFG